jgi:hypothetical protein
LRERERDDMVTSRVVLEEGERLITTFLVRFGERGGCDDRREE